MFDVGNVAIVGSGIIGSSWALVFARAGLKVRIWERGKQGATLGRIEAMVRDLKGTGLEGDGNTLRRIKTFASLGETLNGADYVQELIVENLDAKAMVLKDIEFMSALRQSSPRARRVCCLAICRSIFPDPIGSWLSIP